VRDENGIDVVDANHAVQDGVLAIFEPQPVRQFPGNDRPLGASIDQELIGPSPADRHIDRHPVADVPPDGDFVGRREIVDLVGDDFRVHAGRLAAWFRHCGRTAGNQGCGKPMGNRHEQCSRTLQSGPARMLRLTRCSGKFGADERVRKVCERHGSASDVMATYW
jgi:hypothetical protein